MSKGNWFETRRGAYDLRTVAVTANYTVRTGGSTYNFIEDRVLKVTTTSGTNIAITLSDGTYSGQRILIIFDTEGNNETVTVTPDTAVTTANYSLSQENDYCSLEWIDSTIGWVFLKELTT
ncbi:hypothetical protein LCGC14_1032500 [marine sediment metagenome]|uniref:Uncharacterized protein n=1 Tax=marine sediment metagenome TaxID=412755 RepID=A0A0F9MU73_9ZZZZ